MMYLITYQFNPPNPNGTLLVGQNIQNSALWSHYMDNLWIIDTSETLEQLNARLMHHFQGTDRLMIVALNLWNQYTGWMPPELWNWIRQRTTANNPQQPPLMTLPPLPTRD